MDIVRPFAGPLFRSYRGLTEVPELAPSVLDSETRVGVNFCRSMMRLNNLQQYRTVRYLPLDDGGYGALHIAVTPGQFGQSLVRSWLEVARKVPITPEEEPEKKKEINKTYSSGLFYIPKVEFGPNWPYDKESEGWLLEPNPSVTPFGDYIGESGGWRLYYTKGEPKNFDPNITVTFKEIPAIPERDPEWSEGPKQTIFNGAFDCYYTDPEDEEKYHCYGAYTEVHASDRYEYFRQVFSADYTGTDRESDDTPDVGYSNKDTISYGVVSSWTIGLRQRRHVIFNWATNESGETTNYEYSCRLALLIGDNVLIADREPPLEFANLGVYTLNLDGPTDDGCGMFFYLPGDWDGHGHIISSEGAQFYGVINRNQADDITSLLYKDPELRTLCETLVQSNFSGVPANPYQRFNRQRLHAFPPATP